MKVLLCTPYRDEPNIVRGGINQWGQNILSYYEDHNDGIEIIPISFDRQRIHDNRNIILRVISGIREQLAPVRKTIGTLRSAKPEVLHICTSAGLGCIRDYVLVRAANKHRVKSVLHLHFGRLPDLAVKRNLEWHLLSIVLRRCDVIVPMNKPTENALLNAGYLNVKYLPNPLSDVVSQQITELEGTIERNPRLILFVGHVYKTKGVVELVSGCCGIDGIKLRIVGKYSQEIHNELSLIAESSKNRDWLEFVGEIPHKDVLKEFLRAGLFVFPSYTEGFPNVILEAMASGCSIIGSNVGALPEMLDIDNNPCGICIPAKSEKAVKDAIESLLNNNKMSQDFSKKAKIRVNSKYSMAVVWKQLVDIWEGKE